MSFPPEIRPNAETDTAGTSRASEIRTVLPGQPTGVGAVQSVASGVESQVAGGAWQQGGQTGAVLEALGEAVIVYAADGSITYITSAACHLLGVASYAGYVELPIEERRRLLQPTDEQGRPLAALEAQSSASRLLAGETLHGDSAPEMTLRTLDGRLIRVVVTGKPLRETHGQLTGAVAVLRNLTGQRAAEAEREELLARAQAARREAEDAAQRLRALQAVTDTALSSLPVDDLLQTLLERLRTTMQVDVASVLLLRDDATGAVGAADAPGEAARPVLDVRATVGLARAPGPFHLAIGQGLAGRIAQSRAPLIVSDLRTLEDVASDLSDSVRSALGVPLMLGEQLLGVLHVGVAVARQFTPADVDLLQQVADRVARAIDQAQVHAQVQQVAREAQTQSRELEAVFDAISDGVGVYDLDANMVRSNQAISDLFGYHLIAGFQSLPIADRAARVRVMNSDGTVLPVDRLPQLRALHGEVLTGSSSVDLRISTLYDTVLHVSANAAPLRDADGKIFGAVVVFRDVTDQRQITERTHLALEGFLAITRALVEVPADEAGGATGSEADVAEAVADEERSVAYQLSELTCSVLGCQRVSVSVVDPHTLNMHPIAVVGLDPELEQRWWAEQQGEQRFGEGLTEDQIARMMQGEALVFDLTQPPYDAAPNPYGIATLLIAPMVMQGALVGMLALDYRGRPHIFTSEEIALAEAMARLGAVVLERERLLREREEARGRALALTEANRRMDEFMGIAGHELRTPLTTVKANLQLAQRRAQRMSEQFADGDASLGTMLRQMQDLLERSRAATDRQERLVQDLLDVSRISAGKLEYRMRPLDLAQLVERVADDLQLLAGSRVLRVHVPHQEVPVLADPDRIGQVLMNYVTNAMKYSATEQPVEIHLRSGRRWIRVEVQDRGPGLTAEQQQHLFERFERVPGIEVLSGSGVGLGLGLYICRTIVEQHAGRVGVESTPRVGSSFWFELPVTTGATLLKA